jgi:hypothetical protein
MPACGKRGRTLTHVVLRRRVARTIENEGCRSHRPVTRPGTTISLRLHRLFKEPGNFRSYVQGGCRQYIIASSLRLNTSTVQHDTDVACRQVPVLLSILPLAVRTSRSAKLECLPSRLLHIIASFSASSFEARLNHLQSLISSLRTSFDSFQSLQLQLW